MQTPESDNPYRPTESVAPYVSGAYLGLASGTQRFVNYAIDSLVIVVAWVYYAALIFLIGGEFGQVYELRRTRRLQTF